jgi:hypothetical protein
MQQNKKECNNQPGQTKGKWEVGGGRWCIGRQGRAKRMSSRGNPTTSWTRGKEGHGATRGTGAMRGGDASRWEVVALGEATQQPAGQEVWEAMAQKEAMVQREADTPADQTTQQPAKLAAQERKVGSQG